MLLDISSDPRIAIRACRAWREVVERFGVLNAILPAQFAVARHNELLNVVSIGGDVIVTQQRQSLIMFCQFRPQT